MPSDEYWDLVTVLRRLGWHEVRDFHRAPPPAGAPLVWLDGPNDGPGLAPWWHGGAVSGEVLDLFEVETYQPAPAV